MINKKSLWFLTLFSLILVLSVYYITMPSELLLTNNTELKNSETKKKSKNKSTIKAKKTNVTVEESDILSAMRIDADNTLNEELEKLETVIKKEDASAEEKNEAYEKIKKLNTNKAEEETLEKKLKEEFSLPSYIKIEDDNIKVIINSSEHDTTLANKIMRSIQKNYDTCKYITVQFKQ